MYFKHYFKIITCLLIIICMLLYIGMTSDGVTFEIGEEAIPMSTTSNNCEVRGWECVWQKETATPIVHIAFSPDGTLFATAGKDDRLVKIWFENKQCKSLLLNTL